MGMEGGTNKGWWYCALVTGAEPGTPMSGMEVERSTSAIACNMTTCMWMTHNGCAVIVKGHVHSI